MNTITTATDLIATAAPVADAAPVELHLDVLALVGGGEGTVTLY
jgi:hypothetical protein